MSLKIHPLFENILTVLHSEEPEAYAKWFKAGKPVVITPSDEDPTRADRLRQAIADAIDALGRIRREL